MGVYIVGLHANIHHCIQSITGFHHSVVVFLLYSYMEIYNEKVLDLLTDTASTSPMHSLRVREHPTKGPYVEGRLQWVRVE